MVLAIVAFTAVDGLRGCRVQKTGLSNEAPRDEAF